MRVLPHKLGNQLHALEIVRDSGERERVECETRSVLVHDFVHFAGSTKFRNGFVAWTAFIFGMAAY